MDFFSPHSIYMLSNYSHPINYIMYQQKAHFHHSSIHNLSYNLQLPHFYNTILTKISVISLFDPFNSDIHILYSPTHHTTTKTEKQPLPFSFIFPRLFSSFQSITFHSLPPSFPTIISHFWRTFLSSPHNPFLSLFGRVLSSPLLSHICWYLISIQTNLLSLLSLICILPPSGPPFITHREL